MTGDLSFRTDGCYGGGGIPSLGRLGDLVASTGSNRFEACLASFVNTVCGANQLYLFHVVRHEPRLDAAVSADGSDLAESIARAYIAGQWWRFDTAMHQACSDGSPALRFYQTDMMRASSDHLRSSLHDRMHLRDRIMACGRAADDVVGFSMVRSIDRGPFDHAEGAQAQWAAQIAVPLVAKHWALLERDRGLSRALTDLATISQAISLAPEKLPPREAAVCARSLNGQSTVEISEALRIGRETVVTYRKRLYERLDVASNRDLLLWYLDLYGELRSRGRA